MPRGVAIPELRQKLFSAAERVIVRDGPGGLSSRAVTQQAGVASGLLYAHFADLDDFLAAYAVDRAFQVSAQVAVLPERAGTGTVAENLGESLQVLPHEALFASASLVHARSGLSERVNAVLGDRTAGFEAVESAIVAYLIAEQQLGRVSGEASPESLALAMVGALHHLLLTGAPVPTVEKRLRGVANALATGVTAEIRRQ